MRSGRCPNCNGTWYDTDSRRRFCSRRCCGQFKNKQNHPPREGRCSICGKLFVTGRSLQSTCGNRRCKKKAALSRHCPGCQKDFRSWNRHQVYCSRQCAHPRNMVPCPRCGTPFWPWKGGDHPRKFCGCPIPKADKPEVPTRACLWCNRPFTPRSNDRRIQWCSKVCRNRYQSKKRKLRLRGLAPTPISVAKIWTRDRGRCGLCHRPVSRRHRYPHPFSATLDHIVPITLGGEHSETNVQLAHARCNIAKNNRPCGSQLRLA